MRTFLSQKLFSHFWKRLHERSPLFFDKESPSESFSTFIWKHPVYLSAHSEVLDAAGSYTNEQRKYIIRYTNQEIRKTYSQTYSVIKST